MKIIIELDGPQARRALQLLSAGIWAEDGGQQSEMPPAMGRVESLLSANLDATDAGPAAPALFRAFGRSSDAEAVEKALAELSSPRRPSAEKMQN